MVEMKTVFQFAAGFVVGIVLGVAFQRATLYRHGLVVNLSLQSVDHRHERPYILPMQGNATKSKKGNTTDTNFVAKEHRLINITCLISLTGSSDTMEQYASAIMTTWGKRCTHIVFFRRLLAKDEDANLTAKFKDAKLNVNVMSVDVEQLNTTERNTESTRMNIAALKYVLTKYPHTNWFVRAAMSTFIIIENLKYLLYDKTYEKPIVYGEFVAKLTGPQIRPKTVSINAGIVFSREALTRIVDGVTYKLCSDRGYFPELIIRCMNLTMCEAVQPFDKDNKNLFNSFHPKSYMLPGLKTKEELQKLNRENATGGNNLHGQFPVSF